MADDGYSMTLMCTHYFMHDGSVIVDRVGEPLRKIEAGAEGTIQPDGPAIWDPPERDLTVSEAAQFIGMQQRGL